MKNKIKKLKLPLNKMTGDEKNYAAVLLEDVNSNMKAFWDVLSGVQDKTDNLTKEIAEIKDTVADNGIEISELKSEISGLRTELKSEISGLRTELKSEISDVRTEVKSEISGLRTEFHGLKGEIVKINTKLYSLEFKMDNANKEKFDPKKFLELEKRVVKLEVKAIAG